MHELALAREIVVIVERAAEDHGAQRVSNVRIELGSFGHVEVEALRFAFYAAAKGTIAAGATLNVTRTKGQAWCQDCREIVTLISRLSPCPQCGGLSLEVIGGSELRVIDMEVD
jgi:hydrogenase nickel incorporation protein HypA/HybF